MIIDKKEARQLIDETIADSEFVLVGIGDEFEKGTDEEVKACYDELARMMNGKPYFIISQVADKRIFDSKILDFFVCAPFAEGAGEPASEERWKTYLTWLSGTLGHKLCMLELGVGFVNPQLIRWPFEKTAQYNQKAHFIRVHPSLPQLPEGLDGRGTAVHMKSLELLGKDEEKA